MFPIYFREIRPLENLNEPTMQTNIEKKFVNYN